MTERRQEAARPTLFSGQPQEDIPLRCLAPTVATAIQPDWVSLSGLSLSRQSDALGNGKLVYAIYHATQSQSAHLPSRASHNRKTNWRLVENVSDEMLLKHIADGDKAAMHILFTRHRTRVFRFIQHMIRNPAIADDLVSQVFLDVWRSANKFENRAKVSTWLLSIARFKATSSLRARTYDNIDQDDALGIADAGDTPEAALDRKETSGILRACIEKLSPAHREIIDLAYYHEKSVAEVSEIVGIPHATVKSRMFYARKQLAKLLGNAGFEAAATPTKKGTAARLPRGQHPDKPAISIQPQSGGSGNARCAEHRTAQGNKMSDPGLLRRRETAG